MGVRRMIVLSKEESMPQPPAESNLSEEHRKEIFLALVEAQDQELDVAKSRKLITDRFKISDAQLRQIEREGIDQQWPPL
jgi:hypothetical protein